MKKTIKEIIKSTFSISIIIAILGGGIIFCMFMVAIIVGGECGELLAKSASKEIMPYFIRAASVAIISGLIPLYITGEHVLSLRENQHLQDQKTDEEVCEGC